MTEQAKFNPQTDSNVARALQHQSQDQRGGVTPPVRRGALRAPDSMADRPLAPALDQRPTVNSTGLYVALTAEEAAILAKFYFQTTGTAEVPSLPIPQFRLDNSVRDGMNNAQRNRYGTGLLIVNASDLFLNDLFSDHLKVSDSSGSNADIDPKNTIEKRLYELFGTEAELGKRTTPQMLFFFSDEADKTTDPWRDTIGATEMINNNVRSPVLRAANALYFSALALTSTPGINTPVQNLKGINIETDDYRVRWLMENSNGQLDGVSEEDAATLIEMYQDGGDFNSHQSWFVYFREKYGIDLSNENDPVTALVIGAAKDAGRVTPSGSLMALVMGLDALGAAQEFRLGLTAAGGVQFELRKLLKDDGVAEDMMLAGTAVLLGATQLALAKQTTQREIAPLTVAAVGAEQLIGYTAAKVADGDKGLFLASIKSGRQFAGAIAEPYILALTSWANDPYYTENAKDDFSGNPVTSGLGGLVLVGGNLSNLASGIRAGKYLRQAVVEKDAGKALPAGLQVAALILEESLYIYYGSKQHLPEPFENMYREALDGAEDPRQGNQNLLAPALISAGTNLAGLGIGYLAGSRGHEVTKSRSQSFLNDVEITSGPESALVGIGVQGRF